MNNNKAKNYVKYYIRKCKAAATSHNRIVYASPPVGGSGYVLARSFRYAPFPRHTPPTFCRPWKCYAFPYPGRQNVANSRNVMRHGAKHIFVKYFLMPTIEVSVLEYYLVKIFYIIISVTKYFLNIWMCKNNF
jgi:hypothetical protein